MDSLTDFERRVTSWEHEVKETLSALIKIGAVIKSLEKVGFRYHLLITAGTTEWTKFAKEIESVELARRNTQLVPMDLSAMGSQDQKFQGNCSWCGTYGHMARVSKENRRAKASLVRAKARARTKKRANGHGKRGKKGFHEMEGAKTNKKTPTGQESTEWTDTSWDHADDWTDADWSSSDWSTDLWNDPAWEHAARHLPSTQQAQEQSSSTRGGSISMFGGLTMCELSVNDEGQQREQDDG